MNILQKIFTNQDLDHIDNGEGYALKLCEVHAENFEFSNEETGKGTCQFPDCHELADVIMIIPYEEVVRCF